MTEINGISVPFIPAGGMQELNNRTSAGNFVRTGTKFDLVFREELQKLKFSSHAQSTIQSRDINLSDEDFEKLENAVNTADEKGANEALILLDKVGFIVSVSSRTVISAITKNDYEPSIITNIDSAIIV